MFIFRVILVHGVTRELPKDGTITVIKNKNKYLSYLKKKIHCEIFCDILYFSKNKQKKKFEFALGFFRKWKRMETP